MMRNIYFLFSFLFIIASCEEVSQLEFEEINSSDLNNPIANPPTDNRAPVLSNLLPVGNLPSSTSSVTIQVSTDEVASCKLDINDKDFNLMSISLTSNDGRTHQHPTNVSSDTQYAYFIKCRDDSDNTSDSSRVEFSIDAAGVQDTIAPLIVSALPNGELTAGTTQAILKVTTNENSSCKYSSNNSHTFDQMQDLLTTDDINHQATVQSLTDGSSYSFYILCKDEAQNLSLKETINFSIKVFSQDGANLYAIHCMNCHNPLETSNKKNRTAEQIQNAINFNNAMKDIPTLQALSSEEIALISEALDDGTNQNTAPVLTSSTTSLSVQANSVSSVDILGTDNENQNLRYEVTPTLAFITLNQNANNLNVSLTPNNSHVGSHQITVSAFDTLDLKSNTLTINITIQAESTENQAPTTQVSNNNITLHAVTTESITVSATDPEGDAISFSFINKPSFVSSTTNGNNLQITIAPQSGDVGDYTMSVITIDSKGKSKSDEIQIKVLSEILDVNAQYAADYSSMRFQLLNRHLVYAFMVRIFGDYARDHSDVKKIKDLRDIFGGNCDHYEQSYAPGSTNHSRIGEFPESACSGSATDQYNQYNANFTAASSSLRQAYQIKACEKALSHRNYYATFHALEKLGLNENSQPNNENINSAYRLFYRNRDIPTSLRDQIINQYGDFPKSKDYWRSVFLGLCITPWWQEV